MKKILYCVPSLHNSGGMERVLIEKVNYLVSVYGYDITILTTEQNGRAIFFDLNQKIKLIDLGLNFDAHYSYNLIRKYICHKKKMRIYRALLENFLIEKDIDICISMGGKEIDFLFSLKDESKKIAELHFTKNIRKLFILARKKGKFWEWVGNIRNKQLISVTQSLDKLVVLNKKELEEWEKTNNNSICIPNPSPFKILEPSPLTNKRVIAVGNLNIEKGFEYLIDAWDLVCKEYPDWKLDIYGDGELKDTLFSKIIALNLQDKVFLKGVKKDIKAEYLTSSLYVMSSRYEGLPMVLIEAMSCGLPIISFDCEYGPRTLVVNGENGFLVPVGDSKALGMKICLLIKDESLRKRMGKKSHEYSLVYNIETIMSQWNKLFKEL